MTVHKLIVISMLAVTTVLAVCYVSTFPVEGDYEPGRATPSQLLDTSDPAPLPASGANSTAERRVRF